MTPGLVAAALVAGALGALVRHLVSGRLAASGARRPAGVPLAVLAVNVAGSFIGGAALALAQQLGSPELRYVLLSGLAGGLTTFSTFGVETVQLVAEGRGRAAAASVAANLAGGLLAVAAGWALVTAVCVGLGA